MRIPQPAIETVRRIFRAANVTATKAISRNPNIWETMLDDQIISSLEAYSTPINVGNGCLVQIQTHFLGSRKMYGGWETTDIGVLVLFRVQKRLVRTKVLLLQSKHLYPLSVTNVSEADLRHYMAGFSRLLPEQEDYDADIHSRTYKFDWTSKYSAIKKGDEQEQAVIEYRKQTGIPVFYLLYNPARLPWEVDVPLIGSLPRLIGSLPRSKYELGSRVVPFNTMQTACGRLAKDEAPTIDAVRSARAGTFRGYDNIGYTLEEFIADRALGCLEGYITPDPLDASLERLFFQRNRPISAAIAITLDLPSSD